MRGPTELTVTDLRHAVSVLLVDRREALREALAMLMSAQRGIEVRAEAEDLEAGLSEAGRHQPQVVVLSLPIFGGEAPGFLESLRAVSPASRVLIFADSAEPAHARGLLDRGVAGFLPKDAPAADLVLAIQTVAQGKDYLHPSVGARMAKASSESERLKSLSPRELEVFCLLALGHTNQEIADKLVISVRTVEWHRKRLQAKLELKSRAEFVQLASRQGLIACLK